MKKKKILFIHQNFPGQYKSLAPFLSSKKKYEIDNMLGDYYNKFNKNMFNQFFKIFY